MSAAKKDKNAPKEVETTGHSWDGLEELNNPLPAWWLWIFYISIAFSLLWMILFPSIPLVNKATKGLLGYSSRVVVEEKVASFEAQNAELDTQLVNTELGKVADDAGLYNYAVQGGASVFRTFCSQCHGSDAGGAKGYPNLIDDDWLWGGTLDDIYFSVAHGIRDDADEDTRISEMPAFADALSADELAAVENYVLSLSGIDHDAELVALGATIFTDNCAACHGDNGAGDRAVGAPNLADKIWLHGEDIADINATIVNGRNAVMPHWAGKLSESQIRQVTIYVHQRGGGE